MEEIPRKLGRPRSSPGWARRQDYPWWGSCGRVMLALLCCRPATSSSRRLVAATPSRRSVAFAITSSSSLRCFMVSRDLVGIEILLELGGPIMNTGLLFIIGRGRGRKDIVWSTLRWVESDSGAQSLVVHSIGIPLNSDGIWQKGTGRN
jgi:hypothetical protein